MTWTTDRPTKPGRYWFKNDHNHELEIVVFSVNSIDDKMYGIGLNARGLFSQGRSDNYHGHWAGPLEPPT